MNQAVIETVQTLCRKGNRDSVLTVFQNFPEHFSCIPLNDSNVESKQAINDLLRENVRNRQTTRQTEATRLCCVGVANPQSCVPVFRRLMGERSLVSRRKLFHPSLKLSTNVKAVAALSLHFQPGAVGMNNVSQGHLTHTPVNDSCTLSFFNGRFLIEEK